MLQPFEIPQEVLDADETIIGNVHAFCSAVERGLFWHMWDILCAEAVALDEVYGQRDLELTGIRERRDDKLRQVNELVTRFRSGIRSIYGPDSPEYEQAGGTRTSNRKPPKRKRQTTSPTTP